MGFCGGDSDGACLQYFRRQRHANGKRVQRPRNSIIISICPGITAGNFLSQKHQHHQPTNRAGSEDHDRRPPRHVHRVIAKHNSFRKKADGFVAVAAFIAANRTNQHQRQDRVFQQTFARRKALTKSVAAFTLKFRKFHDLAGRRPRAA
jgi:hypothetical protein